MVSQDAALYWMRLFAYRPAGQGPGRALCATDVGVRFVMRWKFLPGCHARTQSTLAFIEGGSYTRNLECSSRQHGPNNGREA